MDRKLWTSWAERRAFELADEPWLLSKWETIQGVTWPEQKIALMIADLCQKLELESSHWLLDLACGNGWIGHRLLCRVRGVIAIDFSPAMTAAAARCPGLQAILADAEFLPLADSSLDRVLVYFALMNFTDPGRILAALREAFRALKPSGKLLAGQMPLQSRRELYDREKTRYLAYCRERFQLGEDLAKDHAPPIVLFADDYGDRLAKALDAKVATYSSFNHFWRPSEPTQCPWRVDYVLEKRP